MPSIGNTTLTMDWRGRAREREVKLQLVHGARTPYHGLAWSNARTRGKVASFFQLFGVTCNPYHGLAWSNARTRGKVAHFFQHFGVTRKPYHGLPWSNATEREVKLQLFGAPHNPLHGLGSRCNF